MYKQYMALNNLQCLIYNKDKTKPRLPIIMIVRAGSDIFTVSLFYNFSFVLFFFLIINFNSHNAIFFSTFERCFNQMSLSFFLS